MHETDSIAIVAMEQDLTRLRELEMEAPAKLREGTEVAARSKLSIVPQAKVADRIERQSCGTADVRTGESFATFIARRVCGSGRPD